MGASPHSRAVSSSRGRGLRPKLTGMNSRQVRSVLSSRFAHIVGCAAICLMTAVCGLPEADSPADAGSTSGTGEDDGSDDDGSDDGGDDGTSQGAESTGGESDGGDHCNENGVCDGQEDEISCPSDCVPPDNSCNNNGICDDGEDVNSCPDDCSSRCNNDGKCDAEEDPMSCPGDCSGGGGGSCNNNGNCDPGEDPMSCPGDCSGGGGGSCNNNGNCDPGEDMNSCPNDCGGNPGGCNNNGSCDSNETENSCPNDCLWYLPQVPTPAEVDPDELIPILEAFPAPDEVMCELPETCPGEITTFVDPWTGAHNSQQLTRSRNEIDQVEARGQRAWTYFALTGIEGNAHEVYQTELEDAMQVDLDGTTYPLQQDTLYVHPTRTGMWDYLTQAGEARITQGGRTGIDIDGGFFGTFCFDSETVIGFGPYLAGLSSSELAEMEQNLSEKGFSGETIDGNFDYQDHLLSTRGISTQGDFNGEGRLLKIDMQGDHYFNERVHGFFDTYLADMQATATAQGQGDFPVFLNRSDSFPLWTTASRVTVMGGETFIVSYDYPTERRMAPYFKQGRVLNKRVWSWNSPRTADPNDSMRILDTLYVYLAENDVAGGLYQIPNLCTDEDPYCTPTTEEKAALWEALGPYMTYREKLRGLLDLQPQPNVLLLEMLGVPHSVWQGANVNLGLSVLGTGALLSDYQIDYDVTAWADGDYLHRLAQTPWVTQPMLDSYEWVVLAEPEYLSPGQISMLNSYMAGGGKIIVLLYGDEVCNNGNDKNSCEMIKGCRFDEVDTSCAHVVDQFTGVRGVDLYVVHDVNVIEYRDVSSTRADNRVAFETGMAGATLPSEMTSASDLVDLAVFHTRRVSDSAHVWHMINYRWDESTLSTIPLSATNMDLEIPAELEGKTVNVTWFSAPDQRQELLTGTSLGSGGDVTLSITIPAFSIWGTLVVTEGPHETYMAQRERPPYVRVGSYQGAPMGQWGFEFHAVSSKASLASATLWGRAMVETAPQQWEPTGDWKAVYVHDFTEGGTVDAGKQQFVTFEIARPGNPQRFQYYGTACDTDGLCQPFVPWSVMTRPPSP